MFISSSSSSESWNQASKIIIISADLLLKRSWRRRSVRTIHGVHLHQQSLQIHNLRREIESILERIELPRVRRPLQGCTEARGRVKRHVKVFLPWWRRGGGVDRRRGGGVAGELLDEGLEVGGVGDEDFGPQDLHQAVALLFFVVWSFHAWFLPHFCWREKIWDSCKWWLL